MPKRTEFQSIGQELEYAMYITKGARFNSHKRLETKSRLSNLTIALLTSYIIIVNLVGLSQSQLITQSIDTTFIALISTALSILVLVFSQIEYSNGYRVDAEKYHQCAKEISAVYYELRQAILSDKINEKKKEDLYVEFRKNYTNIISRFDNHHTMDYNRHKIEHPNDFDLSWIEKARIKTGEYVQTKLLYHMLIVLPIVWVCWFLTE